MIINNNNNNSSILNRYDSYATRTSDTALQKTFWLG